MPKNALYELSDTKYLESVWGEMYRDSKPRKRQSFGFDGVSLSLFSKEKEKALKHISRKLRNYTYETDLLIPHFIPKPNGKDRVICVPTVRDRLVQRALIKLLHRKGYGFQNSISYGFVKNRSVYKAAKKAIAYRNSLPWAYKADISSFFDSVDRDILSRRATRRIRLRSLHPLIQSIIRTEIYYRHKGVQKRTSKLGIEHGMGLRQGMPASPYLANLMLYEFDRAIEKLGIPMVRYADDLIAFGNSEKECEEIHRRCVELLERDGLHIHPIGKSSKTVLADPSSTVEFLGLGLANNGDGYHLIATSTQISRIKQRILELGSLEYCLKQGVSISSLTRKLEDTIAGYAGVYSHCTNTDQLIHTMEAAKSEAMARLFIKQFGVDFKSLTRKQKQFLEIG